MNTHMARIRPSVHPSIHLSIRLSVLEYNQKHLQSLLWGMCVADVVVEVMFVDNHICAYN